MPKGKRHHRVTFSEAVSAHERALKRSGGRRGIIDPGRIEAAVARPFDGYHRPIYKKAAALIHAVATNHGFVDGNKRTAFSLCYLMIEESGFELRQSSTLPEDDLERLIEDVTTRFLTEKEAATWLRRQIHRV